MNRATLPYVSDIIFTLALCLSYEDRRGLRFMENFNAFLARLSFIEIVTDRNVQNRKLISGIKKLTRDPWITLLT